jgi:two-component system chemotaxis response regulator CheB
MRRIRVVVVDDSSVARQVIRRGLESAAFEVVGTAADGASALTIVDEQRPDAVILDIEMPVLDGLSALETIRARWPRTACIVFTGSMQPMSPIEARVAAAGGLGVVRKPPPLPSADHAVRYVAEHLGEPLMRAHRDTPPPSAQPKAERLPTSLPLLEPRVHARTAEAVVIGASTGGPNALDTVLRALPASLHVPVLVVQHIHAGLGSSLIQRFAACTRVPVVEGVEGTPVVPGRVYVAAPGRHMEVRRGPEGPVLHTTLAPPEQYVRPAVDVLFRTAATVWQRNLLGVVLTGMGEDGAAGSRVIKSLGGNVLIQDRATSVVWGMPGAVHATGVADAVLPLAEISAAIVARLVPPTLPTLSSRPGATP